MSRWLSIVPLIVLAALAALFIGWSLKRDPSIKPDALIGQPIPETVLPMLTGDQPNLMALEARGVAVVGVAWKDDPVATRAFLDELGDPYAMVLVDRDGRAGLDLGITGAPETFAVNAMGQVVAKSSGPLLDPAEIERLVAAIQAPARPLPTATPREPGR